MMTKQNYAAFAAMAHRTWMESGKEPGWAFYAMVFDMMDYFKRDNSRFDEKRFIEALGFDPGKEAVACTSYMAGGVQ